MLEDKTSVKGSSQVRCSDAGERQPITRVVGLETLFICFIYVNGNRGGEHCTRLLLSIIFVTGAMIPPSFTVCQVRVKLFSESSLRLLGADERLGINAAPQGIGGGLSQRIWRQAGMQRDIVRDNRNQRPVRQQNLVAAGPHLIKLQAGIERGIKFVDDCRHTVTVRIGKRRQCAFVEHNVNSAGRILMGRGMRRGRDFAYRAGRDRDMHFPKLAADGGNPLGSFRVILENPCVEARPPVLEVAELLHEGQHPYGIEPGFLHQKGAAVVGIALCGLAEVEVDVADCGILCPGHKAPHILGRNMGDKGGQQSGQHGRGHFALLVRQLLDMMMGAVGHLMAQNTGQLIIGAHGFQQAGVDVNLATGQRKRVDYLVVYNVKMPGERKYMVIAEASRDFGRVRHGRKLLADRVHPVILRLVFDKLGRLGDLVCRFLALLDLVRHLLSVPSGKCRCRRNRLDWCVRDVREVRNIRPDRMTQADAQSGKCECFDEMSHMCHNGFMVRLLAAAFLLLFVLVPAHAAQTLEELAAAHKAQPESRAAALALEASVSAGLPPVIDPNLLPDLPVQTSPLPYGLGILVVPNAYLPTTAAEPQHGWKFAKVTYLYLPASKPNSQKFTLLCAVHYASGNDAPQAGRMASLLALAHQTLVQKTGREAANGTAPFDVWLCAGGQTGGEQWRSNLYLYSLETPRSSIEWIREIVHEYSHLALPAIGGYNAPEYWANGYLGERLLVRWLQRTPNGPAEVAAVWGDFSGASNFDRLLIAPPLALYKKIGPNPAWLARRDEPGMRYLIGQALTFDDKYGAVRLGDAFRRLPHFQEATAKDFAAALSESLSASAKQ